jgi:tetratricopeptide (TPR) repeat protein
MDWLGALLDRINSALAPWAERLTNLQEAPLWVFGALAVSLAGAVLAYFRGRREKAKQAERDADLKALKAGQAEQTALIEKVVALYGAQLGQTAAPGHDEPRQALRDALGRFLTSSDPRGADIANLLIQRKSGEAQSLSEAIAADAEREAGAIQAAAAQANKRAAQKWADASAIAYLNDRAAALKQVERAIALDPDNPTFYNMQGLLLQSFGRYGEADKAYAACQQRLEPNNKDALATVLGNRGALAREQADLDGAEALMTRARDLRRDLGDKRGEAMETANLAVVAFARHKFEEAETATQQAYDTFVSIGDDANAATALTNLAQYATLRGDFVRASHLLDGAGALIEKTGDRDALGRNHIARGDLERNRGNLDAARSHLEQAQTILTAVGDPVQAALAESGLAMVALQAGDGAEVERRRAAVAAAALQFKHPELEAMSALLSGALAMARQDREGALSNFRQALALYQAHNHPHAAMVEATIKSMENPGG